MIKDTIYCTRCCIPQTMEGINFDELGICSACQSSEHKMKINWVEKESLLRSHLEKAKKDSGSNYDCILPISGGKDSFFQAYVLTKIYGLKPLTVTFSHNWYSEVGLYNLHLLLETFSLDHIQFTPSRNLVNRLARRSLTAIGDTCWHCHSGIGAFPLQIAVKFKIPLLIWGESVSETSGRSTHGNPLVKFDRDYFNKISAKIEAENLIDDNISSKDIHPFVLPSYEDIDNVGVWGLHLGDYIFWDDERQMEFVRDKFGWKETTMEGTYKGYKSAECIMPGMHDFTCYLKRGFGRSTWQAALDVRNGLLTREEAFELVSQHDPVVPNAIDYYSEISGYSKENIYSIMADKKVKSLKSIDLPLVSNNSNYKPRPFFETFVKRHKENPNVQTLMGNE